MYIKPNKPKITCLECNEIVNKKEFLKILSLKLKFNFKKLFLISKICKSTNTIPINKQKKKFINTLILKFFWIKYLWETIIIILEESRIEVPKIIILVGLAGLIPFGGQKFPIYIFGIKELWINLQKREIKTIISEIINNKNPLETIFFFFFVKKPIKKFSFNIILK